MVTNTDAILWYNVGEFGKAGYAVPNFSDKVGTLNPQIASLVSLVGQSLFATMQHEDARLRTPPSINTVMRLHRLYQRAGTILNARAVPHGEMQFETTHVTPAGEIFMLYPVPYFLVRSAFMKYCSQLILMLISEMMQHTENTKTQEITTNFSGMCGKYLKRMYAFMATELFGKTRVEAMADGFILTDADLKTYDPTKFFTSTELVDTVPNERFIFTEDQLQVLRQGIPATSLPALVPWPVSKPTWAKDLAKDMDAREMATLFGQPPSTTANGEAAATVTAAPAGPSFPDPVQ